MRSVNIVAQPMSIRLAVSSLKLCCSRAKAIEALPAKSIDARATTLVRHVRQRSFSQLLIMGPNNSLANSHWCQRGEDRAKNQAASKMNGVLGSTGSGMPISPSARKTSPSGLYKVRFKTVPVFVFDMNICRTVTPGPLILPPESLAAVPRGC